MKLQKYYAVILVIFTLWNTSIGQPLAPQTDSSQAIADKIVQSNRPVLVDFWASWCRPCKMLNPVIAGLEETYKDKVLFIKVNVDVHRALSTYFRVSSIPSVFIIHNKSVIHSISGVQPKETYVEALDAVIKNPPPVESEAVPPTGSSPQ